MFSVRLFRFAKISRVGNNFQQSTNAKRFTGTFQRPPLTVKDDQYIEIRNSYFCNRTELSNNEWEIVKEKFVRNYKHVNEKNVDTIIVSTFNQSKDLTLAKSYIRHLKEVGKQPNDATLARLLRVYNAAYHGRGGADSALTKEEQGEIMEIYSTLKSKHDILDYLSCENLIYGLVATENWRESLDLLEMTKISSLMPSLSAFSEVIMKAFKTNDLELGWKLMHEMVEGGKQPKCEIFLTLLDTILNKNFNDFCNKIEKILMFLEAFNIQITKKVATALVDIALKNPNLLEATTSNISNFGKCSSCGLYLENVSLSDEDFKMLQNSFFDKVLIRKDIFLKSTPEEVKIFCDYIERTGPYDCVVDGLNVAYSTGKKSKQELVNLLASVIKYLRNKNKYVLVLGRKHMNNWPKKTMQYIRDNAAVFLANDISQDDPFLLYAALKSGQSTDFFSRDFMRQHAFLLGPELKVIFRRWQQEHQYSLLTQTGSGKIIVKEPIRHLLCAHKVHGTWHVPYKNEYCHNAIDSFEKPEQWLCLKIMK